MKKNHRPKKRQEKRKEPPRSVNYGEGIVLDFYPQGKSFRRERPDDYNPLAVVLAVKTFDFFDVILFRDSRMAINDRIDLSSNNKRIRHLKRIPYSQLSDSALEILPEAINEGVKKFEQRYISFLNSAQPLTSQMHQLQLLPGIGQKRMWTILEKRKKEPFTSFADFSAKTGISDPSTIISSRILTELEGTPKYRLFTKKT